MYVHGESWSWGSSALYDARILATLGRIIVVTFNYRLGVFGELFKNIQFPVKELLPTNNKRIFQEYCKHRLTVSSALTDIIFIKNIFVACFSGFLNTNPSPMTKGSVANYGLVDQMAALQWVVENIEQFGGDSSRITLMGQVP